MITTRERPVEHRGLAAPFACLLLAVGAQALAAKADVLVHDVVLLSPERPRPVPHAWVAIRDERIAAVGRAGSRPGEEWHDATRIDGGGRYLVPGLIDSHVHLASIPGMPLPVPPELAGLAAAYEAQLPKSYLYFGYTTLVDLNVIDPRFIRRFEEQPVKPDLYHCGGALAIANGYPMAFMPPETRFDPYPNFLYDTRQAESIPDRFAAAEHTPAAAVARVAASGGICVKTFEESGFGPLRNLPTLTDEMLAAVGREARARGLVVAMHANSLAAHRVATEATVDIIVHGLWNAPGNGELTAEIREVLQRTVDSDIGYMPTLQVLGGMTLMFEPDFLDDPSLAAVLPRELIDWYRTDDGQWFADELRVEFDGADDAAIRAAFAGGGGPRALSAKAAGWLAGRNARFLFGSDTPSSPTYGNPPGYNGFLEMRGLADAGLSPAQVFRAATIDNAEAFGIDDRYGSIEAGKAANLLLLDGNPLESVDAWDSIHAVLLNGRWLTRQELSASRRSR